MIPWIDDDNPEFPPIEEALKEPDGLLCAGGNLNTTTLYKAYSLGIFPWFNVGQPLLWWSPDPRMVLTPQSLHTSRRLARFIRKTGWTITADIVFADVIQACANVARYDQDGTWITREMLEAYIAFHNAGHAHSIEVWDEQDRLIGGLYGVAIGRMFFGESMFSRCSNSSKVALTYLVRSGCYDLIDCQMHTPHLKRMGGIEMCRKDFCKEVQQLTPQASQPLADAVRAIDG